MQDLIIIRTETNSTTIKWGCENSCCIATSWNKPKTSSTSWWEQTTLCKNPTPRTSHTCKQSWKKPSDSTRFLLYLVPGDPSVHQTMSLATNFQPTRNSFWTSMPFTGTQAFTYENPDTFNLDRFLENYLPGVNPASGFDSYELIPFSGGRRMCPAATLGNLLVSLLMAHLLHSFNWALPEGCDASHAERWEESFILTVCPVIPLSFVARLRKLAFLYWHKLHICDLRSWQF